MNGLEGKDVLTAGVTGICGVLRMPDLLDKPSLGSKGRIVSSSSPFRVSSHLPLSVLKEGIFTSLV